MHKNKGLIIHCPTAVCDYTGQARLHQPRTAPTQSQNLCQWLYVRYGPGTAMIQRSVGCLLTCCCSRCGSGIRQPEHQVAG